MSAVQRHGASPVQRRIALVESAAAATPGDERSQLAMRLLDTMLWVLKGTTRDTWATATPDEADIVVVHQGDGATGAAAWRARGKLVVEVATEADAAIGEHVLTYPFPAKRVLELLENLSGQLESRAPASSSPPASEFTPAATSSAPRAAREDRWTLCESLRTLREVRNDGAWMIARAGNETVLWLRGDGASCVATEATVEALRDPEFIARLELRDGYPPPKARVVDRAGAEFFWFAGFHADDALAPWLHASRAWRVTAWPDFGAIRPAPEALRIVALLAQEALTADAIATRARVAPAVVRRTLNALSLCEALSSGGASIENLPGALARPPGGIAGFLQRIRRKLKIGESG